MSGKEKRRYVRTKLKAEVQVTHPELGPMKMQTSDISDGGARITCQTEKVPNVGDEVEVQVQGIGGEDAPVVRMRVVRIDKDGIGLEFIHPE